MRTDQRRLYSSSPDGHPAPGTFRGTGCPSGLLLFIYRSCAFHNGFQVLISTSTAAHIPKLAYVKLWYPAEIAVNFTQIPLQRVRIILNVRCSANTRYKTFQKIPLSLIKSKLRGIFPYYCITSFPFILSTTPFLTPVCFPLSTASSPPTITYSMPSGYWTGSMKVPLSMTVSGLKIHRSAA